ncbi:hypothetical protein FACS1894147_11310 [Spirochaetia bacterium]|nr:hypothetical protein FACS1894147_11310 [Spirochaetia bacterium]
MKRLPVRLRTILILALLPALSVCKAANPADGQGLFFKDFNRLSAYPSNLPEDYRYTDYRSIAHAYHELVFDLDAKGAYLPLSWEDRSHNSIGVPAYVGDGRMGRDGSQEAVTVIAAALSATLNGIDIADDRGRNFFPAVNAFFSDTEGVIVNNPGGRTAGTSMWYLLYPAILYAELSLRRGDQNEMRHNTLQTIESWYTAYKIIRERFDSDFDLTGFDFTLQEPYRNGIWKEPDAAAGMAVLFYYGYTLTGEAYYLDAAVYLMDYIEGYFGGPLYEVLLYYAPVLMAELNALHGTAYDIGKSLNRVFDGNSIPRGGWGSLAGTWGDYEVNGLFGSKTDGGGYAFAMNSFAAAGALASLARYDTRYAQSIGKWLLHLHSNARYFFPAETNRENQSLYHAETGRTVDDRIIRAVPYEGIRNHLAGKSPYFGGDPTVHGWAETDLALYSGAHTGIMGALFDPTNQTAILRIDLLAADVMPLSAWPAFLYYNPHDEEKTITYIVQSSESVDLFDAVSNTITAHGVRGETPLTIPAGGAIVIVEIPAGKTIIREGHNYFVEGRYISSSRATLSLAGLENNKRVSGNFEIRAVLTGNTDDEDAIEQCTLTLDGQEFTFQDRLNLNTRNFSKGGQQLRVEMRSKQGLRDSVDLRLIFE